MSGVLDTAVPGVGITVFSIGKARLETITIQCGLSGKHNLTYLGRSSYSRYSGYSIGVPSVHEVPGALRVLFGG